MDTSDVDRERRLELAAFVRKSRREVQAPAPRGRRRAPGLRREDVADHAGISTTWYTWLEQARPIQLSAAALERVAAALKLDATGRRYLLELGRPSLSPAPLAVSHDQDLQAFVNALEPYPTYALDRSWHFIAHNNAAAELLGIDQGEGNLLRRLFLDASWRQLFVDWDEVASSSVAQFRAAASGRIEYRPLIDGLAKLSPQFADLWHLVDVATPPLWIKNIRHPVRGLLSFRFASMEMGSHPGITLAIYAPVTAPRFEVERPST